jgi:hypothetical protein
MFLIFIIVLSFSRVEALEKIPEPELTKAFAWKPHKSLRVILKFYMDDGEVVWFAHPMVGFPMGRNDCNLIQEDKYGAKALTTGNSSVYEYNFSKEASMYKTDEGVIWQPYLTRIVVK